MTEKNQTKELEIGGVTFGLASGVLTTLGMIIGINAATSSRLAIIASILTIAISDSLSDALGMYLSEESRLDEQKQSVKIISLFTFLGRFFFSAIFLLPFFFFSIDQSVIISLIFGLFLMTIAMIIIAVRKKEPIIKTVLAHILWVVIVIFLSYFIGTTVNKLVS
ncbi:MAG: hypothetical protein Athens101428_786 [Candidatus Berkelbacteria bacterium Athens1014_28]|uniref:VIT family protein n=1 Tax=Candidatus Berkelbacteria bacterium Athens1014_28 TaxID=2017145 RepID=A0A554LJ08_9BACT|nr:MAG: hypothetical protein Athens101428_786 [Candidatus Berkelbacteria bacterium Athens1014_28]